MHLLLLIIAGLVLWKIFHPSVSRGKTQVVCRNCGTKALSKTRSPRSFWIEIILWFSYLIPGVLYTLWCYHHTYEVCGTCGSRDIIPADSPAWRKLAAPYATDVTPLSEEIKR